MSKMSKDAKVNLLGKREGTSWRGKEGTKISIDGGGGKEATFDVVFVSIFPFRCVYRPILML